MSTVLADKIEFFREKLNRLIEQYGTQNQEVLKCSQKLDMLIYYSYKKSYYESLKPEEAL